MEMLASGGVPKAHSLVFAGGGDALAIGTEGDRGDPALVTFEDGRSGFGGGGAGEKHEAEDAGQNWWCLP